MPPAIPIVHYGLGPIGVEVARLVATRADLRSIAAVEIDQGLLGQRLHALTGAAAHQDVPIGADLPAPTALADPVVVHCTGSSLAAVLPQLLACVRAGYHVVSTCEELSYPWQTHPELARQLDRAATDAGVSVLGTGVNPGYAMDYLPVVLSAACHRVDHVAVHRVQDASARRLPLQRKVGAGLSPAEFEAAAAAGTVRHVGLPESAWAIAGALGWSLTEVTEVTEPVLARRELSSGIGTIPAGHAAGVRQMCRGVDATGERIVLILEMAVGLADPRDEVRIAGQPPMQLEIPGGIPGDPATAAIVANTLAQVVAAPAGLRTAAELPPPRPGLPGSGS